MSITTVTRSLSLLETARAFSEVKPDLTKMLIVAPDSRLAGIEPYFAGTSFHAMLARLADDRRLSPRERMLFPWLASLRSALRVAGVRTFRPNVELPAYDGFPPGTCDVQCAGKISASSPLGGIIEFKVSNALPSCPDGEDLAQLGGYLGLCRRGGRESSWGVLAYVSFREASIRWFEFHKTERLVGQARTLFLQHAA